MKTTLQKKSAIVMGAGIQGCCAALELSHAGWSVTLMDDSPEPWMNTSRSGEGKIHMGYVYANEQDRETAGLMIKGAVSFSGLIDSWVPSDICWESIRSEPFIYAVMAETMVDIDELQQHYAWVDSNFQDSIDSGMADRSESFAFHPARVLASPTKLGFTKGVTHAIQTSEVAVSPSGLRKALMPAILNSDISFIGSVKIESAERHSSGMKIKFTNKSKDEHSMQADIAVNCLWHGRIAIDETLGIHAPRQSLYRLKYGLHGQVSRYSSLLTSTTFVLGAFGDLVRYKDGNIYASWYPDCMTDSTEDSIIPDGWKASMSGEDSLSLQKRIIEASTAALDQIHNEVKQVTFQSAVPGVIVAWGTSDIMDPHSELHSRSQIGVHSYGDYFSIDTGKFTMAPYFAGQLVAELEEQ